VSLIIMHEFVKSPVNNTKLITIKALSLITTNCRSTHIDCNVSPIIINEI